ncbi:beta-N-acetylhexosaminidase [Paenibacillus donghaensis]|uniref:beta-N-acetylhexosaminidase n=1 Tax=Paenibacillus donghaensis TaxID=414771 RepID=UPI001883C2FA|nr:beta-N-acetylhexosaminidase [Paenibacillus donghaensis]MBE9915412.1 beta-N-acetylhexosaminidase [Paenibacillus donghaensis]
MKLKLQGNIGELLPGARELAQEYSFTLSEDGIPVLVEQGSGELEVQLDHGSGLIRYGRKHEFYRALGLFIQHASSGKERFRIKEQPRFETIGPQLDLSRNAVLTVASFQSLIRKLAVMGLNSLVLYMEDLYELDGEPYFGYMRGKYSSEELRAIDDYAGMFGIEAYPCIQIFAHLEEFLKWEHAAHYRDTRGVLLADYEPTYELIENMLATATAPFRSNKVNIGFDEAEELGRGKYLDRYGYQERFNIMIKHLTRVREITAKLQLEPLMFGDMFLKTLTDADGDHYVFVKKVDVSPHILQHIPTDVKLVYWDFFHTKAEDYAYLIDIHKRLGHGAAPAFLGGIWTWNCFGTNYGLSLQASEAALRACKENGVKEAYVAIWGDDGMENNHYNALLGVQLYAEHAYSGEVTTEQLHERVKFCTGMDAESFLLMKDLDETPGSVPDNAVQSNPSKFLLWQDVLLGLFDKQIEGLPLSDHYARLEHKFRQRRDASAGLDYLLDVPEKLCRVLAVKSELGIALKQAYDAKDTDKLRQLAMEVLPELSERVNSLRIAHRKQWHEMYKPFGWEVLDIRYGGIISRLDSATSRLLDYVEGRVGRLEELEQERLPYSSHTSDQGKGVGWSSYYYRIASPNVFFHVLPIF